MNVGLGGYVIKDRLWWYGSYRHQDIQAQLRQLPGQAADDDPQQLQRQGHLQPVDQQQVDRLHAAVAEEAAAALRLVAARRRHRHQQHRSRRRGTRTSGRGCTRASGTACINDNSFAEIRGGQYGYDWTNGVNGTGPALRRHRQQHHQRPQSQLGARAAPQPGARHHQLFKNMGRRSQLQDRRRDLRRDRQGRLHRRLRRTDVHARDAEQRQARRHPVPARRVDRRPADLRRCSSTTRGASATS